MIEVAVSRIHAGITDLEIQLTNSGQYECLNVIFVIRLPAGVMRLRGQDRITASRLLAGEAVTSVLRVRADTVGCHTLTSPNFSYKDHTGRTHRDVGFIAEIIVDPEPDPAPEPRLTAELQTAELPLGEWSTLHCRISNIGNHDAGALKVTLSGQVTQDNRSHTYLLDRLGAGASVDVSFFVCAQEGGAHVPVYLDFEYNGSHGRLHGSTTTEVSVNRKSAAGSVAAGLPRVMVRILFLAADPARPDNRQRLRLDEEIREIEQAIKQGRERDSIQIQTVWAVRPRDITQALIDFEPHLVHFAGHGGSEEESFAAEDDFGYAHVIPVAGLVQAFQAVGQSVRCVIVNACRTERLAQALAATVPWVIGMREPVGDRSAIRFSIGFYQALAAGKSVETAFDVAVALLRMTPRGEDAEAPLLLHGAGGAGSPRADSA